MSKFLLLPIVLGTLLLLTGISGLYISEKGSFQLWRLNETALGPALAFDEISKNIFHLSHSILRLSQFNSTPEAQSELLKKTSITLEKIRKQVQLQIKLSKNQVYENYFIGWSNDWATFDTELTQLLKDGKTVTPELVATDLKIRNFIERINNINDFIQADVKDMLTQFRVFSKNANLALIFTLLFGAIIGLISSYIIIRDVGSLFLIIAEGKQNIENLLNNLDQGFLVFNKSGKIEEGVSKAAIHFFGLDPFDHDFYQILPYDLKQKEKVKAWQDLIFSEKLRFQDFKPLAPKSFELNNRYFELDFRPIYDLKNSKKLNKVICIASDKTLEQKLRQKAESEASLVKLVMLVLSDRSNFIAFVHEARMTFKKINTEVSKPSPDLKGISRFIHTLKGNFSAFHLIALSHLAHKFENTLTDLLTNDLRSLVDWREKLHHGSKSLEDQFNSFLIEHEYAIGKIDDVDDQLKPIASSIIQKQFQYLTQSVDEKSPTYTYFLEHFILEDIALPFKQYESIIATLASNKMKKVTFNLEVGKIQVYLAPYRSLISSFIHLFRNSIDHGIENGLHRIEQGKPEVAKIQIEFEKAIDKDSYCNLLRITIRDDGRGIDPEVVRQKAVQKGLMTDSSSKELTEQEIINLPLTHGFSTRDQVSELSGRGVGLDAVKHEVEQLGGKCWMHSEKNKGTEFFVEVPLILKPTQVS